MADSRTVEQQGAVIATRHGTLQLPAFLPDATRASVRYLDADDLRSVGIHALMANALHLARRPGIRQIKQLGGLHSFMGWNGVVVTDSGGFQILSLVRQGVMRGSIRPNGVVFQESAGDPKTMLSAEKTIERQFALGSDVMVALDDCTGPTDPPSELRHSVERTIRWFQRSRREFDRQCELRRVEHPPVLVGVVQGGEDPDLRRECAQAMMELGAGGFGFGGWPITSSGQLQIDMFALLVEMLPCDAPLFALGVGKPEHVVTVNSLGRPWVFDCTIPTRDARHGRLFAFIPGTLDAPLRPGDDFYRRVYILDAKHARNGAPICADCDCPCCRRYSRAYLHHLFKVKDGLAERLATLHNLRFYTRLIARLSP